MDFTLPEHIETLRLKTRDFVNQKIIPLESDISSYDKHENINEDLLNQIRLDVKAAGLWSPQMPTSRSGLGLGPIGMSALYEEMNRSIFGPVCFNCAAPDDGNMYILNKIGTENQKVKWLDPIINVDLISLRLGIFFLYFHNCIIKRVKKTICIMGTRRCFRMVLNRINRLVFYF